MVILSNLHKNRLTDFLYAKSLLKKYGLWAKKRLGQNFLVDQVVLNEIINSANLQENDFIIEIGPGLGVLTQELLPRVSNVMAVEVDRDIIHVLKNSTNFFKDKIEIINDHILNFKIPNEKYKVVSNIPYQLTSPILGKFLIDSENRPESMTLLVQKEVAEKICDKKKKSVLSLMVEVFGNPEIVTLVNENSFYPIPKVKSAVIHIDVFKKPKISIDKKLFFNIVKKAFCFKRKKIKNNLSIDLIKKAGIDENLRAENLSIYDFESLAEVSKKL